MKKILISLINALLLLLMLECTPNRQEKGAEIAKIEMNKILNNAKSYEPIETKVDSAFSSIYTDEEIVRAACELIDLTEKQEDIYREYNIAKSSAAIWGGDRSYMSEFDKEEYRQASEKINEYALKLNEIEDEIETQNEIINERVKALEETKFYGWNIYHRCRCENGLSIKRLVDVLIIVDEKMENVICFFTLDDYDKYSFDKLKKVINKSINKIKF